MTVDLEEVTSKFVRINIWCLVYKLHIYLSVCYWTNSSHWWTNSVIIFQVHISKYCMCCFLQEVIERPFANRCHLIHVPICVLVTHISLWPCAVSFHHNAGCQRTTEIFLSTLRNTSEISKQNINYIMFDTKYFKDEDKFKLYPIFLRETTPYFSSLV